jgi:hypothetical protein
MKLWGALAIVALLMGHGFAATKSGAKRQAGRRHAVTAAANNPEAAEIMHDLAKQGAPALRQDEASALQQQAAKFANGNQAAQAAIGDFITFWQNQPNAPDWMHNAAKASEK